nr:zinc finger, CCHC-type [Tanacetum cinerariifolium]
MRLEDFARWDFGQGHMGGCRWGVGVIWDQSGTTLRVSQFMIHNEKLAQTMLEGYSILSLENSLSKDCDMEKTGCLKSNLKYIEALLTTKARYMTFTKARKKEIWLKVLLTDLGYELRLVATGALVKESATYLGKVRRTFWVFQEEQRTNIMCDVLPEEKMIIEFRLPENVIHPHSSQVIHPQSSQVINPQSSQTPDVSLQSLVDLLQFDSEPAVPSFLPTDDPLEFLHNVMAFMCTTLASSFPLTNSQLETSSNPINQVDMQGRQTQCYVGNFSNDGIDLYDSDCDDISTAKEVLMANLSNYGSDVISKVPHSEPYHHDMDNQSVHAMQDFKQTPVVDFLDNEITSDSNIIMYS